MADCCVSELAGNGDPCRLAVPMQWLDFSLMSAKIDVTLTAHLIMALILEIDLA